MIHSYPFGLNYNYWSFWGRCGIVHVIYVCQAAFLPREFVAFPDVRTVQW